MPSVSYRRLQETKKLKEGLKNLINLNTCLDSWIKWNKFLWSLKTKMTSSSLKNTKIKLKSMWESMKNFSKKWSSLKQASEIFKNCLILKMQLNKKRGLNTCTRLNVISGSTMLNGIGSGQIWEFIINRMGSGWPRGRMKGYFIIHKEKLGISSLRLASIQANQEYVQFYKRRYSSLGWLSKITSRNKTNMWIPSQRWWNQAKSRKIKIQLRAT